MVSVTLTHAASEVLHPKGSAMSTYVQSSMDIQYKGAARGSVRSCRYVLETSADQRYEPHPSDTRACSHIRHCGEQVAVGGGPGTIMM